MKIFNIDWSATTAGPSPNQNRRIELFLKGCSRALNGKPCKGCFNQALWSDYAEKTYKPRDIVENIKKFSDSRYITISGGEPFDQLEELTELCILLKKNNFHIILYTSYNLDEIYDMLNHSIFKSFHLLQVIEDLLDSIDILIDGQYKEDERIYEDNGDDGFLSSIGSGNQKIYDFSDRKNILFEYAKDLDMIALDYNNNLHFFKKEVIAT